MIDFKNENEVVKKLAEIKAKNLPHMTIEQFSKMEPFFKQEIEKATDEEKKDIIDHLYHFYRSEGENKCIFSEEYPSLTWGLRHGTGVDTKTGLSWECYHYFNINGKRHRFERTFQYHPDCYEV